MLNLNAHLKATRVLTTSLAFLLSACASLKTPTRNNLTSLKTPGLIGSYPTIVPAEDKKSLSAGYLPWNYFKHKKDIDSNEVKQASHFTLELTDKKNVTVTLYNGSAILKKRVIKGGLKGGYFRLKHRFTLSGVPLIFWKTTSEKTQFGIGSNQELFIDFAETRNGGFLFFMAGTPDQTTSITIPQYRP